MSLARELASNRGSAAAGPMLACLLALLRLMTDDHYTDYVEALPSRDELAAFLGEIFGIFTELITRQTFPKVPRWAI